MLKGKTVVIGITGSIAAYKMADFVSRLVKKGCDVHVIMTANALQFINPITFETLTSNKCLTDTFDRNFEFHVSHVSLAKKADIMLVAPASADVIGKMANGIADDMLTTTFLAMDCPVLIAPAMNTRMYQNSIVKDNLMKLKKYGYEIIEPADGYLACGDCGTGKLASLDILYEYLEWAVTEKDLKGKKIMVTAGPTREAIDPVRFITNHSSGKMGYALAKMASLRGADVLLISGPCKLSKPFLVNQIVTESAQDMFEAVRDHLGEMDAVIMAAAVADYCPEEYSSMKMKKTDSNLCLKLKRTQDILQYAGGLQNKPFLCGFAMETEQLLERGQKKRIAKNADMIIANSLVDEGAGFETDTNKVTIITENSSKSLSLLSKIETADEILNAIFIK